MRILPDTGHAALLASSRFPSQAEAREVARAGGETSSFTTPIRTQPPVSMEPQQAIPDVRKRSVGSIIDVDSASANGSAAKRRKAAPSAAPRPGDAPNSPIKTKPEKPAWRKSFPHRPYHCLLTPYNCVSSFSSKNEWKRHISTQHMRLGFWRCDQCPNRELKPNDFNRKDLFTQHLRRMHPLSQQVQPQDGVIRYDDSEDRQLAAAAERCYVRLRGLPEGTNCVFCGQAFEGLDSWNGNLEHVAKHMEQPEGGGVEPKTWRKDEALEAWLINENLVEAHGERWVLQDTSSPNSIARARSNSIRVAAAKPKRRASEVTIAPTPTPRRESVSAKPKSESKRVISAPWREIAPPPPPTDPPAPASAPALAPATTPIAIVPAPPPFVPINDSKRITRNRDYRNGLSDESLHALGLHRSNDARPQLEALPPPELRAEIAQPTQPEPDADVDSESEIDEQSGELLNRIAAFGDYEEEPDEVDVEDDENAQAQEQTETRPTEPIGMLEPPKVLTGDETVSGLISEMQSRVRAMTWWADSALFASQWRPATALDAFLRSRSRSCPCPSSAPRSFVGDHWHTPLSSPIEALRGKHAEKAQNVLPDQQAPQTDGNDDTIDHSADIHDIDPPAEPLAEQVDDGDSKVRQDLLSLRDQIITLEQRLNLPQRQSVVESTLGMVWGQLVRRGDPETLPNALLFNLVQNVAPNVITSAAISLPGHIYMSVDERGPIVTNVPANASAVSEKDDQGQHSRIDSAYSSNGGA